MSQNYPFTGNAQTFGNDFAVNEQFPGVLLGGTEANALYYEDREVAGTKYYNVQNATFNKVSQSWLPIDTTKPAYAMALTTNGATEFLTAAAGVSPISSWTVVYSISNDGSSTISFLGVSSVKSFGAKGDGVSDDSADIQKTLNAAALSGNAVFFPSGTYLIGTPLTLPSNNLVLLGCGPGSILKAGSAGNGILYDTNSRTGTQVSHLTFDGNSLAASLLTVNGGSNHNTFVDRCIFQNVIGNAPAVVIGGQTAPIGGSKISPTSSRGVRVSQCLFQNNATGTREALLVDAWQDSLVDACVFYNNSCNSTGLLGIWAYCYHVSVRNCIFTGNIYSGTGSTGYETYANESTHISWENCTFDAHTTPGNWGGAIISNCTDAAIENCRFDGYGTNAIASHDWITDPDSLSVIWPNSEAIKISGNVFYNCAQVRLPQDAGGSFNTALGSIDIVGNHFFAVPAEAITLSGNGVTQTVGPVNLASNTVEGGTYTGSAIGLFSGTTALVQGNWVGDSSGVSSAGFQIDAAQSAVTVYAYDNVSLNHVAAFKQTNGATFVRTSGNVGLNPIGHFSSQPAVPSSTVSYTNNLGADATVCIATGGGVTISAIAIGGQVTGLTMAASASLAVRVPVNQTIALTYSGGTPTWVWFGD